MKKIGKNAFIHNIRNIICLCVVLSFFLLVLLPTCSGQQFRGLKVEHLPLEYSDTIPEY